MLKGFPPKARAVFYTAAVLLILLAGHLLSGGPRTGWRLNGVRPGSQNSITAAQPTGITPPTSGHAENANGPGPTSETDESLPCQQLPNAKDITVIMRTGATEIQDKLPVHFNTTFKCYSDLLIFSDYGETFMDHEVHDVFRPVNTEMKQTNPDFELYLRLQAHGRASLHPDELSGKVSFEGSKAGKRENAGWRLDKYKFLPMMVETLRLRPDKKYYIFVESDSYVVWSNVLQWIQEIDPQKPMYAGSEVQIGPDLFAHGGSVFMMTNPALRKGAETYEAEQPRWNDWTTHHWAGDCVLGKALHDNGVDLTWAWPMFQGGQPEKMDFTENKGWNRELWCRPALSYHHFSPTEMKRMWDFEQEWVIKHKPQEERGWSFFRDYSSVLHHRDVFKEFVWPQVTEEKPEWNNLSPDQVEGSEGKTFEECKELCEGNGDCLQFNLAEDGCWLSTKEVMLGQPWGGTKSGWMMDRIEAWMHKLDSCGVRQGWTVTS